MKRGFPNQGTLLSSSVVQKSESSDFLFQSQYAAHALVDAAGQVAIVFIVRRTRSDDDQTTADKDGGQHPSFHLFHAFFNKFRTDCLEGNKKVCNFATK